MGVSGQGARGRHGGRVRKLLGGWLLALCAGMACATEVPLLDDAGYNYCANEGNDAMALGRMVMVFNRTQAELEADARLPPYIRSMAGDFFRAQAAGEVPTYAHFALRRFLVCLQDQKVRLTPLPDLAFACLTRVDIPYFFFLSRGTGATREAATQQLEKGLAGWGYPPGLITALAEPAWLAASMAEVNHLQLFIFNSCLLPPDEVRRFYGAQAATARAILEQQGKVPPAGKGRK